jgi:coenzyme F420-reducing hydrogenase gamma subunit
MSKTFSDGAAASRRRPTLAVFKFASCDGCQLTLLDAEDELLQIADAVEIAYFLEARTRTLEGPYDVGLVEGSVTTAHDRERIREIRAQCRYLVTIGACATAGGIQALRNWADVGEFLAMVYARPDYISTLATSTPISDHVPVDFELRGCPVDKGQLLELVTALVLGRVPRVPRHRVCVECKERGPVCVSVARGIPCLGPVTQAGCGALCPSYGRECFGCFGPQERANVPSLLRHHCEQGGDPGQLIDLLRNFNVNAVGFRETSEPFWRQGTVQAADGRVLYQVEAFQETRPATDVDGDVTRTS